jgi:hypothetical protein
VPPPLQGAEGAAPGHDNVNHLTLYLVKQCLDAMGSEVAVASSEAEGTTFTFALPVADLSAEARESAASEEDAVGTPNTAVRAAARWPQ